MIESVYKGVFAAFGGGLLLNPTTMPGKIITVGLSPSVMVFMSIYGAQVTTALVESRLGAPTGTMSSFEEGLDRGAKFCVYAFVEPFIKSRWPTMQTVPVGAGGKVYELFDALYEGKCEASLIIENWWGAAQVGIYSQDVSPLWDSVYKDHMKDITPDGWKRFHCDDKLYPIAHSTVPWSISNGIPVREELVRLMRFAVQEAQNDPNRRYSNYQSNFRAQLMNPVAGCSAESIASDTGDESVSATLEDGVGATFVSMIFTVFALMIWGMQQAIAAKSGAPTKPADAEQGVDVQEKAGDSETMAHNNASDLNERLAAIESSLKALINIGNNGSNADAHIVPNNEVGAPPPRKAFLANGISP
uniref:Uncharacterized protein n=1 Tax=Hemiselmis andersenii TaxID=464988 RepID=A0A6U4MFP7_HEMAN|mmetsp:Transcript_35815/g.83844  ORF Transcript_35815/g.83844 Transcript_35815/m.83844 type:complete len:360 (-) Transcript_35815:610-1689(-)